MLTSASEWLIGMEQFLLPLNPNSPLGKVPYLSKERYDGLPFIGHAKRKGKFIYGDPSPDLVILDRGIRDRLHPHDNEDQESFFQTWLFFGLLSEIFQGNFTQEFKAQSEDVNEILDFLYSNFVYEENGKKYVTTAKFLPIIDALMAASNEQPEDVEGLKSRASHMAICIRYAAAILGTCSQNFNPDIRLSIAAMGESLMWVVSAIQEDLKMEQTALCVWEKDCFTIQMQEQMTQNGWCPSDIAKCKNSLRSVQALNFISKIDKSKLKRNHSNCEEQFCTAGQIDLSTYKVGHVKEDCNCDLFTIDNVAIVKILEKNDKFPVLKIYGGNDSLSDLKIDILESDTSVPFVAISHVSNIVLCPEVRPAVLYIIFT